EGAGAFLFTRAPLGCARASGREDFKKKLRSLADPFSHFSAQKKHVVPAYPALLSLLRIRRRSSWNATICLADSQARSQFRSPLASSATSRTYHCIHSAVCGSRRAQSFHPGVPETPSASRRSS